jgi:hypothetical protein
MVFFFLLNYRLRYVAHGTVRNQGGSLLNGPTKGSHDI